MPRRNGPYLDNNSYFMEDLNFNFHRWINYHKHMLKLYNYLNSSAYEDYKSCVMEIGCYDN